MRWVSSTCSSRASATNGSVEGYDHFPLVNTMRLVDLGLGTSTNPNAA